MQNTSRSKLKPLALSQVLAHRGACGVAPENTLAAMRKAHELGAKWVEFDVMLTQDGVPIIFHDTNTNRTTDGGFKNIAFTTYEKIAAMDAGSWFDAKFAGEKVPTLEQLLTLLRELGMHINVELKPTKGNEVATAEKTLEVLVEQWDCDNFPPLVSSEKQPCLQVVHEQAPHLHLGCVIHRWHDHWQDWLDDYDVYAAVVNEELLNPESINTLHNQVDSILSYTVNDAARAHELFAIGVDAVFSDYPDLLV